MTGNTVTSVMPAGNQPTLTERWDESVSPRLVRWLVIAIVITMPFQLVGLPAPGGGWGAYLVDVCILLLFAVGWGVILWDRRPVRFPFFTALILIVLGSLLGTLGALDRAEALSTLLRDIYVWMLFYTGVNLIRERHFLDTLIRVWVVVAVLESLLIIFASRMTADETFRRVSISNTQALQELEVPSLASLPSEYKQAKHVIKRAQIRSHGPFLPGGFSPGTFANADFTVAYLGYSFFLALVMPLKRQQWLRYAAAGLILLATPFTGVSAAAAIPVGLGLFVLLICPPRMRAFLVIAGAFTLTLLLLVYSLIPYLFGYNLFDLLEQSGSKVVAQNVGGIASGAEDRLGLLTESWREFRDQPLGLGPHGLRASGVEKNVHNEYAAYLFERGFLGLAGLLLMRLMLVAIAVMSMWRGDRRHRVLMAALLAALLVQSIMDLTHELLRQRDVWMLSLLLFLYADLELQHSQTRRQLALAKKWPWAYPGGGYVGS